MNSYEKIGRILRLPPSYEHVCRIAFCKISRVRLLMSVLYSYFMPVWRNFRFASKPHRLQQLHLVFHQMGWVIKQLFHASVCSIVELLSRGAVDDLMHYCTWPKAECNNASGRPGY